MLGFWLVVYGLAILVPVLATLPLLALYKGCPICRHLMWRAASKCPHCHEWFSRAPVAR